MKKYLLVVLLFFGICKIGDAQNYKLFQSDSLRLYSNPYSPPYLEGLFIDSTAIIGQDTVYFNFGIAGFNASTFCMINNYPIFIGKKIICKPDGISVLFNNYYDSIFINTLSLVGETWELFKYVNGDKIIAQVSSIDTLTILGASDSIKNIILNVVDSLGTSIISPVNNKRIQLSKEHGVRQSFYFPEFPYYLDIVELQNRRMMTIGDLYRYSAGDTIQTRSQCHIGSNYGPVSYSSTVICDVYYSSGGDTLFYRNYCSAPFYNFISNLNDPVLPGYPGKVYNNSSRFFQLYYDNFCASNTLALEDFAYTNASFEGSDSCFYNLFEPGRESTTYIEGTGCRLYNMTDPPVNYPNILSCEERISFYKHNNFACGFFNTGIDDEIKVEEKLLLIYYPNPVSDKLHFKRSDLVGRKNDIEIRIYNMLGQILKVATLKLNSEELELDISGFPLGVYSISLNSKNIFQKGSFVKIN